MAPPCHLSVLAEEALGVSKRRAEAWFLSGGASIRSVSRQDERVVEDKV
jgi:hypothetical protein